MANAGMKPVAGLLLVLNFCMYVIVAAVGGWAINHAINYGFFIGNNNTLYMPCSCVIMSMAFKCFVHQVIGNSLTDACMQAPAWSSRLTSPRSTSPSGTRRPGSSPSSP
jgi:hypothetical protein